jgi:hypothetical protein
LRVWDGVSEALPHGLLVVSARAGAIPDTVPAGAGLLVPTHREFGEYIAELAYY